MQDSSLHQDAPASNTPSWNLSILAQNGGEKRVQIEHPTLLTSIENIHNIYFNNMIQQGSASTSLLNISSFSIAPMTFTTLPTSLGITFISRCIICISRPFFYFSTPPLYVSCMDTSFTPFVALHVKIRPHKALWRWQTPTCFSFECDLHWHPLFFLYLLQWTVRYLLVGPLPSHMTKSSLFLPSQLLNLNTAN